MDKAKGLPSPSVAWLRSLHGMRKEKDESKMQNHDAPRTTLCAGRKDALRCATFSALSRFAQSSILPVRRKRNFALHEGCQ